MPELSSLPPPPDVPAPSGALLVERVRAWPRSLQVLAAVAVAVAAGAGWFVFEGRAGVGGGPPPELSLPRATPAPAPAELEAGEEAHVHVAGAVARPGVYRVPGGSRVTAVLDAAGGPLAEAEVDQLNLAARVRDGERIYVPRKGEALPPGVPSASGAPAGPLDLNTATIDQLDSLPGVGPSTAQAIVDERQRRGRFRSVEELLDVRGIGEARLAQIRAKVRV